MKLKGKRREMPLRNIFTEKNQIVKKIVIFGDDLKPKNFVEVGILLVRQ
jgi:hypothetical protein